MKTRRDFLKCAALGAAGLFSLPRRAAAAAGSPAKPNILIILADDMGFSDAGCYGGEISTPNLDRLAAEGLRFTRFYNTGRCWPTRSCLLTGYYPQQIRMDPPQGRLPAWTRVLPHYLKPLGYRCYHSGKWHLNGAPKAIADGGFDRSYLLLDHDRYFNPQEHEENDQPLPAIKPDTGAYTTTMIADHAIKCLQEHAAQHAAQPFFEYLAFTSPHFPLHAFQEDIDRCRERYRAGWDAIRERRWQRLREMGLINNALPPLETTLKPRYFGEKLLEQLGPGEIRTAVPWKDLTEVQRQLQATKFAIHAAMVGRMDREIGRVLAQVRAMGALENTVIFFLSDNGADATLMVRGDGHDQHAPAGSRQSFLCIGPGWASASNAPFRRHKIWVHEGGISTPLIVHWPKGIAARGELRHALGHVTDFVPTLLELAGGQATTGWNGVPAPALPGKSLVPAFAHDGAVTRDVLYFNHAGNHALRVGDWKLVSATEDKDVWSLYNLANDRCEMVDLAAQQPERVNAMKTQWQDLSATFRKQSGLAEQAPRPKPKAVAKGDE
jgi:arylsulfatase